MPYLIVGNNKLIAWGFTNVGPTVTDVYIEISILKAHIRLRTDGCSRNIVAKSFTVKGKADVSVGVKITRHGPVITEIVPGETRPLALRWTL